MPEAYTVIVENDETVWADQPGVRYHFPKRYARFLQPGTRLIHYKGKQRSARYAAQRLSPNPHYFAISIAGEQTPDPNSDKGDLFVELVNYQPFEEAVPFKIDEQHLESIPDNRTSNYWRDGVRQADRELFARVAELAGVSNVERDGDEVTPDVGDVDKEGSRKEHFLTRIERNPKLRNRAIAIHGTQCAACETSMVDVYGAVAEGHIHIHHLDPLAQSDGPRAVDPRTDLVPLCPNCHAVAHLGGELRSVEEIRRLIAETAEHDEARKLHHRT